MLSDLEKFCLSDLLKTVEDYKLSAIAGSVTSGRMKCNSREDAISCILLHTESLTSFFLRRKVGTKLLFNYLHKLNASVPGNAPRETLIKYIFDAWESLYSLRVTNSWISMPTSSHQNVNNILMPPPAANRTPQLEAASPYQAIKNMMESEKLIKEANAMAFDTYILQFSQLYYHFLNQSSNDNQYLHSLNESHFFADCKFLIKIQGDEEETEVLSENVVDTLSNLSTLKKEHGLHFEPNLSEEGIRGKKDCHGLIQAMACGTLHKQNAGMVGCFKQAFVLRKDPFAQQSCKIVESTLILTSSKAIPSYSQLMLTSDRHRTQPLAVANTPTQLQITDVTGYE